MLVRCTAIVLTLSALAASTADARHHRFGNRCCSRPAKCESVQETKECEAYAEASIGGGGYNAFAGPDGIYGINTFTGQVYKYDHASGEFKEFGKAIK